MITHPWRWRSTSDIADVMYACAIMHNMIIEDGSDGDLPVLNASRSSQFRLRQGFTLTIASGHNQSTRLKNSLEFEK
jgi:hypothetical protein